MFGILASEESTIRYVDLTKRKTTVDALVDRTAAKYHIILIKKKIA